MEWEFYLSCLLRNIHKICCGINDLVVNYVENKEDEVHFEWAE